MGNHDSKIVDAVSGEGLTRLPLNALTSKQNGNCNALTYGGGLLYDSLGSYTMAWRIGVALGLAGGIIQVAFALIRPSAPPMVPAR